MGASPVISAVLPAQRICHSLAPLSSAREVLRGLGVFMGFCYQGISKQTKIKKKHYFRNSSEIMVFQTVSSESVWIEEMLGKK